ncbi:MAG: hypothetical protein IKT70_06365 [Clostridia bacterium]|nr:hypothetical protein [Clostridia bacterium]
MLKKTMRSALAVLLTFIMIFSLCGTVLAGVVHGDHEHGSVINYVSIGDSMTNGYGFEGYEQTSNDRTVYDFVNGKGVYGVGSYALQFEEYLKDKGYDVNHTKLAPSALLADDLLYLLGARDEEFDDGWSGYRDYVGTYSDAELKSHFQNAVINADVITMCIGNASFGAYLVQQITDTIGIMGSAPSIDPNLTLENGLALLENEDAKQVVLDIYADMKAELAAYTDVVPEGIDVDAVLDVVAYTVSSFLVSYEALVDRIVELNPDVEVVLIGLMNTTYGMTITGEGFEFPFGDMMDSAFEALNNYIAFVPVAKQLAGEYEDATFYYADQPAPEFIVQAFDDLAANNWENIDGGRLSGKIVRQRNLDAYNDGLRDVIGAALGFKLPFVSMNDLQDYVPDEDYVSGVTRWSDEFDNLSDGEKNAYGNAIVYDVNKQISVAIYLAIEEAVVANVDTMEITVDGLMGIAGDIFNALGEVPESIKPVNGPTPLTIKTELVNWFNSSENGRAMCKVYALFKVGNGMSVHPTPTGHDNIANAVIAAYENEYTAAQKVVDTAIYLITEYYDDAYAFGYQYADENGYVDDAVSAIDSAIDAIVAINVDGTQMTDEFKADLKAELVSVVATLTELKTVLSDDKASDIDGMVDAILALEDDLYTHLGNIDAILVQAGSDVNNLVILPALESAEKYIKEEAIPAVKEAAKTVAEKAYEYLMEILNETLTGINNEIKAIIETLKTNVKNAIDGIMADATTAEYVIDVNSYYVALGDSTAVSDSYVDLLADEFGIPYKNLATDGITIEDVYAIISENSDDIARADLITVGFGGNTFISAAVNEVLAAEETEFDWEKYVGAAGVPYVEEALAEVYAYFVESGLENSMIEDLPGALTAAVEAYVYSCVAYGVNLPTVVNTLKNISPEALIIIVGMYNPMDDVVISLGDTKIDISEYVDYLVEAAALESLIYAVVTGDAVYVDAPEVDTLLADNDLSILDLVREFVQNGGANLNPSADGHEYIKTQILDALTVTYEYIRGDVNGDGYVNDRDAIYLLRYTLMPELYPINQNGDMNGDGDVNDRDAIYLLRYTLVPESYPLY